MEERITRLEAQVKELETIVSLLLKERNELKEAERQAAARDAEMWAYYQEEEYKARQEGRQSPLLESLSKVGDAFSKVGDALSEGCRNA